ncbi:serine/threonine-protein kinase [Crateriforma conspicua]|uniref:non-specific serine/threonine protein kinase n=1 Tax=Crateriforma conspicua TaxID=2527996 RepID=A0A5C5Y7L3_9PLAN|nr:serine/threonine-protein kinase [Crateriforma conspicua]QDV65381.1 Serine/threonine-protein kinase PrkC [Crateriforma conspicua]TWT70773.1 Serine/threonine-protein kinase PrkC [Crateriforma conspicua]
MAVNPSIPPPDPSVNECNRETIEAFLSDQLSQQDVLRFEAHLETCDQCRRHLDQTAADNSYWTDARSLLSDLDFQVDPAPDLSFLQPTDDPDMLGRLGTLEISGVIGTGGMGIVLKALDRSLNRFVAVKVLAPHLASSAAARTRFTREAQAAAAVVHDNVIAIHGVETSGTLPYLTMPYVKGESLQRRIDRLGPLPIEEILRIGMQIARGLAAAHQQGLIHRDIKPSNILLPHDVQRVVITDFGLARTVDDATLTRSGVIAGTPQFMSPEQARGDTIDPRSDLFSLGSVVYAMASGRPPFRADSPYAIIRRIVDDGAKPLRQIDPSLPAWFENLVERLHAKDPDRRISSAEQAAELFKACLAHVQNDTAPLPPALLAPLPNAGQRWRPFRWLVSAIAAALIVITIWFFFDRTGTQLDRQTGSASDSFVESDQLLLQVESEIDQMLEEF